MINPGELNDKIEILTLSLAGSTYQWSTSDSIWAKAEQLSDNKLLMNRRTAAKSVKFTVRKCSISLNNAILWMEKHCIITDITEIDRMYYEITTIVVETKTCVVKRGSVSLSSLNRPVTNETSELTFPGYLIETYSRKSQEKPMAFIEMRFILKVPDVIKLKAGEIIDIESTSYEVWVPRSLSDYANVYEIRIRRDA
jgi:hypothetical protein